MVVIEVRNAELMETVAEEAKRLDIANGAIVSLIGAVDRFTISTMPRHDATKDIVTDYTVPAEMEGDSTTDITAAHAAGAMSIGYTNKPGKTTQLVHAEADAVIHTPATITEQITATPR